MLYILCRPGSWGLNVKWWNEGVLSGNIIYPDPEERNTAVNIILWACWSVVFQFLFTQRFQPAIDISSGGRRACFHGDMTLHFKIRHCFTHVASAFLGFMLHIVYWIFVYMFFWWGYSICAPETRVEACLKQCITKASRSNSLQRHSLTSADSWVSWVSWVLMVFVLASSPVPWSLWNGRDGAGQKDPTVKDWVAGPGWRHWILLRDASFSSWTCAESWHVRFRIEVGIVTWPFVQWNDRASHYIFRDELCSDKIWRNWDFTAEVSSRDYSLVQVKGNEGTDRSTSTFTSAHSVQRKFPKNDACLCMLWSCNNPIEVIRATLQTLSLTHGCWMSK